MNRPILFLTVGGSHEPLLTAMRDIEPDRVVFFASKDTVKIVEGQGNPIEKRRGQEVLERLPNLVTLMNLKDSYQSARDLVELENIDDVQHCYQQMLEKGNELAAEGLRDIHVDYTGGTKSMSAALVMVAIDEGWEIHVTTGISHALAGDSTPMMRGWKLCPAFCARAVRGYAGDSTPLMRGWKRSRPTVASSSRPTVPATAPR